MSSSMDHSGMHTSGLRRPNSRGNQQLTPQASRNFMGLSVSRPNRYRQTSGGPRNSLRRLNENESNTQFTGGPVRPKAAYRRYRVGDNVLICCNSHWATLVNRYGFPPGEGTTAEEQSGPYSFVMASVQTVHFDEFAEYYTVRRSDNGQEQRADTGTQYSNLRRRINMHSSFEDFPFLTNAFLPL